jgi:hypothetical protein
MEFQNKSESGTMVSQKIIDMFRMESFLNLLLNAFLDSIDYLAYTGEILNGNFIFRKYLG